MTTRRRDIYIGSEAREASEKAVADAKKRQEEAGKMPFRFYMSIGDEKSFIILDEEPSFMRWEHEEWDDRGKRMKYHGCIAEYDNCPACDNLEHRPYFAMYLSIIDLTPFTTKNGDNIEYSKKLLIVKQNQHKLFFRKAERGTLRGWLVDTFRDKKTDARIGGQLDFAEQLTDAELTEYKRVYEDRDGKEQTEDVDPYDYEDLFPETTLQTLSASFGSAPAAGSSREVHRELNDNYDKAESDDSSTKRSRASRTGRPSRATRSDTASDTPTRSASSRRQSKEDDNPIDDTDSKPAQRRRRR
jgi:hypothetical protein